MASRRFQRNIFGTGDWRNTHNDELNNLYLLPAVVMVIRSKQVGECYAENLKCVDRLGGVCACVRIILTVGPARMVCERSCTRFNWLRMRYTD